MLRIPTERNIFKHLTLQVYMEATKKELDVDLKFIEYLVDLLLLNPKYLKHVAIPLTRISLSYFETKCINFIKDHEIQVKSLKLQNLFRTYYIPPKQLLENHHESILKCTAPLLKEITSVKNVSSANEINQLYRKMSVYIILATGLGNPSEIMTLKENTAGIESVYPKNEIYKFVSLTEEEKLKQMNDLVSIVAGIRLFNKDCKKGGDTIVDVPKNLTASFKAIETALYELLGRTTNLVARLTTALDSLTDISGDISRSVILELSERINPSEVRLLCEVIIFYRQLEIYLRTLLKDLEECMIHSNLSVQTIGLIFEELHRIVRYKDAVPIVSVYPYFDRLWQQWRALQNQLCVMSNMSSVITGMELIEQSIMYPANVLETLLEGKEIVTDQKRLAIKEECPDCVCRDFGFVSILGSKDSLERRFEFLGFCPMALSAGVLIPGNPKLKVTHRGKDYAVSKEELRKQFEINPKRYCDETLEFARDNPVIINLLDISEELDSVKYEEKLICKVEPKAKSNTQSIQTDTHPIPRNIVHNYHWNLWRHKEMACQWSNIVNCQTHSTQTHLSHCRGDIQCQTVDPRNEKSQTKVDTAAGVPTQKRHLWKIRVEGDQVCDVDLTRPIEED